MATAKRLTKAQREAAQSERLRTLVLDIASGAEGENIREVIAVWHADAGFLGRFLPALRSILDLGDCEAEEIFALENLGMFHDIDSTVDYLWGYDVRVD